MNPNSIVPKRFTETCILKKILPNGLKTNVLFISSTAYSILSFPKTAIDDAETTIPDASLTTVPMTFTTNNYPLSLSLNLDTPVTSKG